MVNLLKYVKAPPPGTRFTPNLAVVLAPAFRTLERVGVYLHNAVLNKTEFGIMDKRYNKNVHGPYCRFRYYGPPGEKKLLDVRLSDLSAWFSRRDKSPGAMWNELTRQFFRVQYFYISGPFYQNLVKVVFRVMIAWAFTMWLFKWPGYLENRVTLYHW